MTEIVAGSDCRYSDESRSTVGTVLESLGETFGFSCKVFDGELDGWSLFGPVDVDEAVVDGTGIGAGDAQWRGIIGGAGVGQSTTRHFEEVEGELGFVFS